MKLVLLLSILTAMLLSFSYAAQAQEEGDTPQVKEGFYAEGEEGDEEDDGFETVEDEPLPVIERKKDKKILNSYEIGTPTRVKHPLAKKGLLRITKERTYIYKVKTSKQKNSSSLRFGSFKPTKFSNTTRNFSYSDIYTQSLMIFYDYEWQIFKGFGKFGLKAETGLLVASGNGILENGDPAREIYSFFMMPNAGAAIYRFQYWDKQKLVPFVEAGAGYYTFAEIRDDGDTPKLGGAFAGHFAVGTSLDLAFIGGRNILDLDREYGINSIWLTMEFRGVIGLDKRKDVSANTMNFGVMTEF